METGSSGGGGRRPGDDAHGLNFGKKIYFEQDASGGSGSSGGGGGGGRKGKGVAASGGPAGGGAGGQQPRCQVAGCGVDLTGVKGYYCRHKVCKMHAKAPVVVVAGIEQRFCQQCSRFHQVTEFDQGKRSCRRRLAGHNERRRKPPPGPASRYGRLSTSLQEDPGRLRSFLLDFSYPRAPSSVRDPWPTIQPGDYHMPGTTYWQGSSHEHHPQRSAVVGYGDHHAYTTGQGSSSGGGGAPMIPTYELPSGEHIAGVAADSSCALSLLSTQPWDTSTHTASHNNRSPAMSTTSAFQGSPVAPSVVASNYMAASSSGSWGSPRGHGGARNMQQHHHHHLTHDTVMTEVHPHHHGQFGELELALQQGRAAQNPPDGEHGSGSGGAFSHSSNAMNWSL